MTIGRKGGGGRKIHVAIGRRRRKKNTRGPIHVAKIHEAILEEEEEKYMCGWFGRLQLA